MIQLDFKKINEDIKEFQNLFGKERLADYACLFLLLKKPFVSFEASDIAEDLEICPETAKRVIKQYEDMGFIVRVYDKPIIVRIPLKAMESTKNYLFEYTKKRYLDTRLNAEGKVEFLKRLNIFEDIITRPLSEIYNERLERATKNKQNYTENLEETQSEFTDLQSLKDYLTEPSLEQKIRKIPSIIQKIIDIQKSKLDEKIKTEKISELIETPEDKKFIIEHLENLINKIKIVEHKQVQQSCSQEFEAVCKIVEQT